MSETAVQKEKEVYKVTSKDINILIKQIPTSKEEASILLKTHEGDIVECIMAYFNNNTTENNTTENNTTENNTTENNKTTNNVDNKIIVEQENQEIQDIEDIQIKLDKFRHILDEKDRIFNTVIKSNLDTNQTMEKLIYVCFDYDTKPPFKKLRKNATRNFFMTDVVRKYLEYQLYTRYTKFEETQDETSNDTSNETLNETLNDTSNETLNETSEEKNKFNIPTNKIITKVLQRGAIKLCRKWGMHRAVMMFFSNQIRRIKQIEDSLEEVIPGTRYMDIINKTATKFLTKAEYLKQGQVLCGPCVVVNNLA